MQTKTKVGGHGTIPLVRLFRMRITLMTNGNNHLSGINHGKAKNIVMSLNHCKINGHLAMVILKYGVQMMNKRSTYPLRRSLSFLLRRSLGKQLRP